MSTYPIDLTEELVSLVEDLQTLLMEHHPDGPHDCPICGPHAAALVARFDRADAALRDWKDSA
jgi:hypothetical protein